MIDWIRKAAEEIHDRLPEIDAEAGQAGQVTQDIDVERETFVSMVAEILERHSADDRARLAGIEAAANADAADLEKMRDGTKLTRSGLVSLIEFQRQEIEELKRRLAKESEAYRNRLCLSTPGSLRDFHRSITRISNADR